MSQSRIGEQVAEPLQADVAFADVLVPVFAIAQLALGVVEVQRLEALQSNGSIKRLNSSRVSFLGA